MNSHHTRPRLISDARALATSLRECFLLSGFILVFILAAVSEPVRGQGGSGHMLFGDLKIADNGAADAKPLTFDVILYFMDGRVFGRQPVTSNGRYRFMGLKPNEYDLVIELENREIARIRINLGTVGAGADHRQDVELEWGNRGTGSSTPAKKLTVSADDFYKRSSPNQSLFEKAQAAIDKKNFVDATALLKQVLDADAADFQAWTELGTVHLLQKSNGEAEKAYQRAAEIRPSFFLGVLNLGRVRVSQKKYDEAIDPLTRATELQPQSAEANFLLGESYLQIKKGSKAVGYLSEAARLGRADAHLRLGVLYNAAGLKDRAAAEYEQFLAKEPNYADKAKLAQYIKENKKQ